MHLPQVHAFLHERHEPKYRFEQIKRAFYVEKKMGWDEVGTLAKTKRQARAEAVP